MFSGGSTLTITALVDDITKVIVKIAVYDFSPSMKSVDIKKTPFVVAAGPVHCTGIFVSSASQSVQRYFQVLSA